MDTQLMGIVGGLGPAATVIYYNRILAACRERAMTCRLLMSHAEVEIVLAAALRDDRQGLAAYLCKRIDELGRGGANIFALTAVTPHLCMPELRNLTDKPIVDLVEAVGQELARRGLDRVALIGTRATVASRLFGRLGSTVVDPPAATIEAIHELYVSIARAEMVSDQAASALRALALELTSTLGARAIVLAGTDLALAPPEVWAGMEVVDCAQLHVNAIVRAACATR